VIVTFEGTRAHMSFDLPGHIKMVTENGIPYTNGATETYITEEGFHEGASYESWNDKDTCNSCFVTEHPRIVPRLPSRLLHSFTPRGKGGRLRRTHPARVAWSRQHRLTSKNSSGE